MNFRDVARLLGHKVVDTEFKEFLNQIGEAPMIADQGETYWLREHGIRLDIGPRTGIYTIFIYCRVPESWQSAHGSLSPFPGELPLGVIPADTSENVKAKLGQNPKSTYYEKQPCIPWEETEKEAVIQDLLIARRTGQPPDGIVSRSLAKREKEPYDWFAEVYDIENCEVDFCFLLSDSQLIGLQLSMI